MQFSKIESSNMYYGIHKNNAMDKTHICKEKKTKKLVRYAILLNKNYTYNDYTCVKSKKIIVPWLDIFYLEA